MTKDEALKLALEALEPLVSLSIEPEDLVSIYKAITAIKEALAQPEQEPVVFNDLTSLKHKQTIGPIESAMRERVIQDGDLMNVIRQAVFDTAEIDFKVEYYALLRAYTKQRDALEKASKEIDEQWKLLQTATARIVDLQTHIDNFDGEDR